MRLLDTITVHHASGPRHIQLYQGDLANIPESEAVDLLIVSAFPDDYVPTSRSLIGALDRSGVSVAELAMDKAADLRETFSCWLSKDISAAHRGAGFRRLLCFEPATRGGAAEVVGDIFRAIMPVAFDEPPIRSIAMPIVASGEQEQDPRVMLEALLDAAMHWLERGLPVEVIKIVVYAADEAEALAHVFADVKRRGTAVAAAAAPARTMRGGADAKPVYDCFISYARSDAAEVDALVGTLKEVRPGARIFVDRLEIKPGQSWQAELDRALESCRKVIAVYSPAYLRSKMCLEEFNMARVRHRNSDAGVIVPIYLHSVPDLPLYMQSINYVDCRERDAQRIDAACRGVVAEMLDG